MTVCGWQSRKYLLNRPLRKKFAQPHSKWFPTLRRAVFSISDHVKMSKAYPAVNSWQSTQKGHKASQLDHKRRWRQIRASKEESQSGGEEGSGLLERWFFRWTLKIREILKDRGGWSEEGFGENAGVCSGTSGWFTFRSTWVAAGWPTRWGSEVKVKQRDRFILWEAKRTTTHAVTLVPEVTVLS